MVFYIIEKNEVLRNGWEIMLKSQGEQSYICDCVGDFKFIAEDLNPDFFICDGETLLTEWNSFKSVIGSSEKLARALLITVGANKKSFQELAISKHFDKPLHLHTVYQELLSLGKET